MNDKNEEKKQNFDLSSIVNNSSAPAKLHVGKYFTYIIEKKLWIILSAILFSILYYFGLNYYKESVKEYTASTVIRFDDPRSSRGISALTDFSAGISSSEGKAEILHTNLFLDKAVDSLQYKFLLNEKKLLRTEFLESIKFSDSLKYGSYILKIKDGISLFYIDKDDNEFLLKKFSLKEYLEVKAAGFEAIFRFPNTLIQKEIKFSIVPQLLAMDVLKKKISYSFTNRSNTTLKISFNHKDPNFVEMACNKIAKLYISHLLDFKKYKTTSILASLEEQLRVSQKELKLIEANLQVYQERNPRVYLTQDRGGYIRGLVDKEVQLRTINNFLRQIAEIEAKLRTSTAVKDKNYLYQEALSFLEQRGLPGVSIFLTNLTQEIYNLEELYNQHYNDSNPVVIRLQEKIENIFSEANKRLSEYKNDLNLQKTTISQDINASEKTLKRIPKKQLKLAELERERQIKGSIVSSIMSRYNEAKVSDAAILPDVQIIDYASVPLALPESMVQKLLYLIVGAIIGIVISIGLLVLWVAINGKFWTNEEFEEKTGSPILAKLPILSENSKQNSPPDSNLDPMLVTQNYVPTQAGESFRKMRALLDLDNTDDGKSILVSSMNPSEGKSFVSINLATVYAQQKQKVLLVDGDIRKGVVHSYFKRNKKPGLTDILISNKDIDHNYISQFVQATDIPNLYILSSGQLIPNPAELLSTIRFENIISVLSESFSKLVVDSAPFSLCSDLFIMNRSIKKILLVTKFQSTNLSRLIKILKQYQDTKNHFVGTVVNFSSNVNRQSGYSDYNYYKY